MKTLRSQLRLIAAAGALLGLAGCDHMTNQEQRIVSGGAIGAAAGVAVTAATGGSNLLLGAALGGAGGAVIGGATH